MMFFGDHPQPSDSARDPQIQDQASFNRHDDPISKAEDEPEYQRGPLLPYGLDAVAEFTYGPDFRNKLAIRNAGYVTPSSWWSPSATELSIPSPASTDGGSTITDTSDQDLEHINQRTSSIDYSYNGNNPKEQQDQPVMVYDHGEIPTQDPEPFGY